MKRMSPSRAGRAAVCISLCLALGCSCSMLPPASGQPASSAAASVPTDADGKPLYDPAILDDGQLRILYTDGTVGSTVLCGGTVLYQGTDSETLSLVQDTATGECDHYFRSWSDNTALNRRRSALYDKEGKEVLAFEGEYSASLSNGILVLSQWDFFEDGNDPYGSCRVIDLASGQELPVPDGAFNCIVCGDRLVYRCYTRPADLADGVYDDDSYIHMQAVLQDRSGNVLDTADACTVTDLTNYGSLPSGWVQLETYTTGYNRTSSVLYNPMTGEALSGLAQICGNGTACFSTEDGRYALRDMTAEGYPVLGTFDVQPSIYFPGSVILWNTRGDYSYELQDLVSGEVTPLYAAESNNNTVALYTKTGTLRVYDQTTGELLTDAAVEPVENQQSVMMDNEGNGYVWLELRDNDNYETTATRVYGPTGLVSDLTSLQDTYHYLGYLTTTADGQPLYYGTYDAPGSSYGTLSDVLDKDGTVVLHGLANCYGYYSNSLNGLPDGIFAARRGFYAGWMDSTGNWIFCRSIFGSLDGDDTQNYYF